MRHYNYFVAIVATALFLCAFSPVTRAEQYNDDPVHEIYFGYGYYTGNDVLVLTSQVIGAGISGGQVIPEGFRSSGCATLGYGYKINKWLRLGGSLSYEYVEFPVQGKMSGEIYDQKSSLIVPMFEAKFNWLRREHLGLYSGAAVGIMLDVPKNSKTLVSPAFNLCPIGFEFGGNFARGFIETNWGIRGFLSLGVRFRF